MALAISNGHIYSEFGRIRIKHPLLEDAHKLYDDLRYAKRHGNGQPQKWGALFAPSQSGKTMSITTYIETVVVDELIQQGKFPPDMDRKEIARLQKTVVHVTLSAKATPKSLAIDILTSFGDPAPSRGTTQGLLKRAYEYLRYHGTELLAIDEIQHLSDKLVSSKGVHSRAGIAESTAVTDTLKTMLLHGLTPMIFVGIAEARHHLFNDVQLAARCVRELNFAALDIADPAQRKVFFDFVGKLGLKLKRHELFEEETDLLSGDVPACIHAVAGGRLGMAANLVLAACVEAREQKATRVTREHLSDATDGWAIPMGLVGYNPFRIGARQVILEAAE
jgi:hypothetical protein